MSIILIAWYAYPVSARTGSAAFDKLKSLVGEWEGKAAGGHTVQVSYHLVSGGSAVMETIKDGTEAGMITMYHLDGDALMMTHYCSIGNQPRMRAVPPAGEINSLKFNFVDVTNIAKNSAGRMQSLTITFQDKNHIKQEWTYSDGGKEETAVFSLERKK